ncbi:RNA polymerase sigma factor [Phenylobacterium sp.]|jgi:DNA-directed RNA polymerase specialized sigma24 family protein|uniref:RNA polymerase sigma factor n=1 Tax=Phenylobacterium sp. TaxID=1871053 RepID=UPI002E313662|nr:sigma factor [Phenylobacterium sp.]HEX3365708.1 sigma factor [Phenylobacterium sp.]
MQFFRIPPSFPVSASEYPIGSDEDRRSNADAIYRQHSRWVVAFLARRFGREIAEDLAQETFLRLSSRQIDWEHPKAILARAALNVGLDHLRREAAQRRPKLVTERTRTEAVTLPDQYEALLHREVVASLPRNLRDVYCLSRFGGLTFAYKQQVTPTGSFVERVGQVDFPARLRARLNGDWTRGPLSLGASVNHVSGEHDMTGVKLDDQTTLDLRLRWTASETSRWPGVSLGITARNVFDEQPPFYNNPLGFGIDGANADVIGRFVSIQFSKNW